MSSVVDNNNITKKESDEMDLLDIQAMFPAAEPETSSSAATISEDNTPTGINSNCHNDNSNIDVDVEMPIASDFNVNATETTTTTTITMMMDNNCNYKDEEDDDGRISGDSATHQRQMLGIDSATSASLKEELDSGDELPASYETEHAPIHEIRCGLLTARLHMCRFTCPGIHRKCVEFEGKLVSPRQFTIKAEKDKQKDWKGSIRLGKHNLRTLMEMKTLDFYDHQANCSLKCQSRNYIKNRKNENSNGSAVGEPAAIGHENNNNKDVGMVSRFDLGEPADVKSVASTSSAASTRKSSAAVLEDYVSQTVPSMGFGSYTLGGNGTDQMMANGFADEQQHPKPQNGTITARKTPSTPLLLPPSSATPASAAPSHHSVVPAAHFVTASTVAASPQMRNGHAASIGTLQSPLTSSNHNNNCAAAAAAALNLLQQSPLKQLFTSNGSPHKTSMQFQAQTLIHQAHQQQQQSAFPPLPHHHTNGIPPTPTNGHISSSSSRAGPRTTTAPPPASMLADMPQEAALALLLQSVQTSILMEQQQQQQKVQQHGASNANINATNNLLLAQLAQLNGQPTFGAHNGNANPNLLLGTAAASLLNGSIGGNNGGTNGIERLLNAAALFPQQQQPQQKTPVKQQPQQEPVNVANIRKSMEENASLFWSQMRNMGLLEDMLRTLSDTLDRLKQIYLTGGNVVSEEFAAQRLSGVALALDLCSLFGEKIHSRYIQATLESTLISKELLELQRKQEEQKRKLETAKRKSQVFDQLLKNGSGGSDGNGTAPHHGVGTGGGGGVGATEPGNGAPKLKKIHLNI